MIKLDELIALRDWHEMQARELVGDEEQEYMFVFHNESTELLSSILSLFPNFKVFK
jgi:hypothetical protein